MEAVAMSIKRKLRATGYFLFVIVTIVSLTIAYRYFHNQNSIPIRTVHNYNPTEMYGLWVAEKKYEKPIVGVLANGTRVNFPNTDPFHTISSVNRCKRYVYTDMMRSGGPNWCVSYGCRCLVTPGGLIGNELLDPPNGVLIDLLN